MKSLFRLAAELQSFFEQHHWQHCFIGGIALQRWGQPRLTNDVDVTLLTGFGGETDYIDPLMASYRGRIPETREFALKNRVLLLASEDDIPIDIALGGIPFEENVVARSSMFSFLPDLSLLTCSAEDLVVLKSFAGRFRDWADVESILARQEKQLDWDYILEQLEPLCDLKEAPELIERLNEIRKSM